MLISASSTDHVKPLKKKKLALDPQARIPKPQTRRYALEEKGMIQSYPCMIICVESQSTSPHSLYKVVVE